MRWEELRQYYPKKWLVVEVLEAHSENGKRILDDVSAVITCTDGTEAVKTYQKLRRKYPEREFCFLHTDRNQAEFEELLWTGVRGQR